MVMADFFVMVRFVVSLLVALQVSDPPDISTAPRSNDVAPPADSFVSSEWCSVMGKKAAKWQRVLLAGEIPVCYGGYSMDRNRRLGCKICA